MIRQANALMAILQLLLPSIICVIAQAGSIHKLVKQNAIENASASTSTSTSLWLKKVGNREPRPRPSGCWNRPWICRQGESPGTQMRCCKNYCVDVSSDINNCGLCEIRCQFSKQCCRGFCTDTNRSPLNCGRCGNRCPWGVKCVYGMCGYDQPWPPRPPQPPQPHPPCHKPPKACPPGGPHPPGGDQPSPMP